METFMSFSKLLSSLVVLYLIYSVYQLNRRVAKLEDLVSFVDPLLEKE